MQRRSILRLPFPLWLTLVLLVCGGAGTATAQSEEKKGDEKRGAPAIDQATGKKLNAAIELLNADKFAEAKAILAQMDNERMSPYENSRVFQMLASVANAEGDNDAARRHLEASIASGGLNDEEISQARFQIAQLYIMVERWQDGLRALQTWLATATNPNSSAYYLLAIVHYQLGDHRAALDPAQKAVDLATDPKASWIELLLALRLENEDYRAAVPLLKRLVVLDPTKKSYWIQWSGVNRALEEYNEALAVLEVARVAGFVETDSEYRGLAELEMYVEIPHRAARMLEEKIADRAVEADENIYEKLSQAWIQARDYEKALVPLERAAELHENGNFFVRLAEVQLQLQDWKGASSALQRALDKGDLRDTGTAQLMMGVSLFSLKQPKDARPWFQRATGHEHVRRQAEGWLRHIDATLAAAST